LKLTIARNTLDEIRKGMRKVLPPGPRGEGTRKPALGCIRMDSAPGGVRVIGTGGDAALLYAAELPENADGEGSFLLPFEDLVFLSAKGTREFVTFTDGGKGRVNAGIFKGEANVSHAFKPPALDEFPDVVFEEGLRFRPQHESAVEMLAHAVRIAPAEPGRYALNAVCLAGDHIAVTDGRRLLVANSFAFPRRGRRPTLVPPSKVFCCRTITGGGPLSVAVGKEHVYFRFGDRWTLRLPVCDGHYPDYESIVPSRAESGTVLELSDGEVKRVREEFSQLPDGDVAASLHLDGKARFDVDGGDGVSRAVELPHAKVQGRKLDIAFNPGYFLQALALGLRRFHFTGARGPVLAEGDGVKFLFMPIEVVGKQTTKREEEPMEEKENNNDKPNGIEVIVERVGGLKESLRQALNGVVELERTIKAYGSDLRKREKLVRTTLASLKELKRLAP